MAFPSTVAFHGNQKMQRSPHQCHSCSLSIGKTGGINSPRFGTGVYKSLYANNAEMNVPTVIGIHNRKPRRKTEEERVCNTAPWFEDRASRSGLYDSTKPETTKNTATLALPAYKSRRIGSWRRRVSDSVFRYPERRG